MGVKKEKKDVAIMEQSTGINPNGWPLPSLSPSAGEWGCKPDIFWLPHTIVRLKSNVT